MTDPPATLAPTTVEQTATPTPMPSHDIAKQAQHHHQGEGS